MKKLVKRAQGGDADAFVQLIEENRQSLYKVAVCYVKNPEDAADVIQDTILSAFEKIGDLRQPKYFRTWLIRMLINKAKDFLEKRSWEVAFGEIPEEEQSDHVLEHMMYEELIQSVDEQYRDILVLHYVEGFPTKEIGELLDMKDATVRTRLRRGREDLRRAYERQSGKGKSKMDWKQGKMTMLPERTGENYAR